MGRSGSSCEASDVAGAGVATIGSALGPSGLFPEDEGVMEGHAEPLKGGGTGPSAGKEGPCAGGRRGRKFAAGQRDGVAGRG